VVNAAATMTSSSTANAPKTRPGERAGFLLMR
jgi:hypothetical protein